MVPDPHRHRTGLAAGPERLDVAGIVRAGYGKKLSKRAPLTQHRCTEVLSAPLSGSIVVQCPAVT